MAKIQISINDDLLEKVDVYAKKNYLSRSGFLALASSQYLNHLEMVSALKDMSVAFKKIAQTGIVDDETMEKLEAVESMASMMMV